MGALLPTAPNAALTATTIVNEVGGLITAAFDAGAEGLAINTADHFNIFGVIFGFRPEAFDPTLALYFGERRRGNRRYWAPGAWNQWALPAW